MSEKIQNGWKWVKLGEIVFINSKNLTPNYPYDEIYYLDTGSVAEGRLISSYKKFYLKEAPSRAKRIVSDGDIVYSLVRPIQRHYIIIKNPPDNLIVSTGFAVITADNNKADNRFIYYYLTLNEIVEYLDSIAEGSTTTYPSIVPDDLKNLIFPLPPLPEQKAIAEVLSSIDDKIDLLHRQNKTLEEMAMTLFRKWFIDANFDGTIGQIVNVQGGYAFKSKDFKPDGNHSVIKIKNITNSIININDTEFIDESVVKNLDIKFKIFSGDVLIAMTGAEIGKLGIVPKTNKNLWLNQRVGLLRDKYDGARFIAYLHLKSEFGYDYIINAASGSAQANISASDIENCPFVQLSEDGIKAYSKTINPFFEKIIFNLGQIQTLEKLRDTLLPKLMSGEVRIMK